jgi:hypothetical protein
MQRRSRRNGRTQKELFTGGVTLIIGIEQVEERNGKRKI